MFVHHLERASLGKNELLQVSHRPPVRIRYGRSRWTFKRTLCFALFTCQSFSASAPNVEKGRRKRQSRIFPRPVKNIDMVQPIPSITDMPMNAKVHTNQYSSGCD
ncbi:hypothetical protein AOLI_G00168200 [Acnodon oligacanthus]